MKDTTDEKSKQSGEICEKITQLLESLTDVDAEVVLVAMIERTATVAASWADVSESTSVLLRDGLAKKINRLVRAEVSACERWEGGR